MALPQVDRVDVGLVLVGETPGVRFLGFARYRPYRNLRRPG
jgi:hypothetical protein